MKNWDDLKFCLALERFATMTAAAEHLGTNTATVSRRIERITQELGQTLFTKQGQSWQPTAVASKLITIAAQTEEFLTNAEAEEQVSSVHSDIRINAPLVILQSYLAPIMGEISNSLQDVTLILSLYHASLAFGETDILLSSKKPDEGRLIRKKIGTIKWRTYCDVLHKHKLVGWADLMGDNAPTPGQWELSQHFGKPPLFCMQGVNLMRLVMNSSPIVARLPEQFALTQEGLIEVDIGCPETSEIWLSYHYTRRNDQAIRRVVDKISDTKQ